MANFDGIKRDGHYIRNTENMHELSKFELKGLRSY